MTNRPGWKTEFGHENFWITIDSPNSTALSQGWKLHVSAIEASAARVLEATLPILLQEGVSFKCAASMVALNALNEGEGGLSQVGKFLTVYPNDDEQAVRLALALDEATRGFQGVRIPSDKQLSEGSLVHYRYGGYGDAHLQTPLGEILPAIIDSSGDLIPDLRHTSYEPPDKIPDPFEAAGISAPTEKTPILIGKRYLIVATLHRTSVGTVYQALDIEQPSPCILKQSNAMIGMSSADNVNHARLRREAAFLQCFSDTDGIPAFRNMLEDNGHLYLVQDEISGETLERRVAALTRKCLTVPLSLILEWASGIARILESIHEKGCAYRDLKSSNVMVDCEGEIWLIDFDSVQAVSEVGHVVSRGTPGYASPQQSDGGGPAYSDDIFSFGALLHFVCTGAEPSVCELEALTTVRRPAILNPAIPEWLDELITRCLSKNQDERFSEIRHVVKCLDRGGEATRTGLSAFDVDISLLEGRYRSYARAIGDALCDDASRDPLAGGLSWVSTHDGSPIRALDLGMGSAGAVLALAEIVSVFSDARHEVLLWNAARCLASQLEVRESSLPGMYVGRAGIGSALLRAGQVLRDSYLVNASSNISDDVGAMPYVSPDFYNGVAGRLLFHLLVWDETRLESHKNHAVRAGDWLLSIAESSHDRVSWVMPEGYESLSGTRSLGYAHGAAGIADALLDLFEATNDQRYLACAVSAGRWLEDFATAALADNSGLTWPIDEGGGFFGPFWCHGSTGIGQFFLHLGTLTGNDTDLNTARRAGRAVAIGGRWVGPTQCHGLAGNIEFLLNLWQSTHEEFWLHQAYLAATVLEAFAVHRSVGTAWQSDIGKKATPDYLVGYAGVAPCLLRLTDCSVKRPRQLSRHGFRFRDTKVQSDGTVDPTKMHI